MRDVVSKRNTLQKLTCGAAVCLPLLITATPAVGQVVAGYSEYYIPADEDNLSLALCTHGATACASTSTHSVISVTAWADTTTLYYDHWENGYNFDPANPTTADETDTLNTGQRMVFESGTITLPRTATPPATSTCTKLRNGVAATTNPNQPYVCYDGRDRIYTAGGPVTVTRVGWNEGRGVGVQGAAWEIYPVKPQLTTYVFPFGENNGWYGFQRVAALIQATADNTTVTVDLNGDGVPDLINANRNATKSVADGDGTTITLNRGETFLLDQVSACTTNLTTCTTNPGTLNSGTTVLGSSTLQVKYITGRTNVNYCTRGFSAFPRGFWTSDYYAPLDQPTNVANGLTDYYLYNPNSAAITVNWEGLAASGSFNIPATSSVSFRTAAGTNVPVGSGLYFRGSDVFWGVGSNDADAYSHEWGFSLLPSTMLFKEHFLGWAPDAYNPPANPAGGDDDMGAFLSVAQDNTTVFVDYDNNGAADQTYTLNRLQTQYVVNPTTGDLSGAHFWGTGPFTLAYGQNGNVASTTAPALDLGYVALPATDFISLVLGVSKSVSPQVVPTASGSTATFTLTVSSQKYAVNGVNVTDLMPPNWQYVSGSTTILRPDQTTLSGAAADPTVTGVPATGQTLSWTTAQVGNSSPPSMLQNQGITITFTGQTTAAFAAGTLSQNRVTAVGTRTVGGVIQTFTAKNFAYVTYGNVGISKTSSVAASTPLYPGDTVTYTTQVTNPSGPAITGVSLYDPIPAGTSYVAASGSVTCERASNVRDEFSTVAYTNNNGSANWAGAWTETDSAGGGAASGLALVTGNRLRLGFAENVRDEFGTVAYTNNGPNNTANWSGSWTETDAYGGGATGAGGGFAWITGGRFEFRYLLSTVRDEFTTDNSYSGNYGSDNWRDNWTETGDDGSASSGNILIDNGGNRLSFDEAQVGDAIVRTATLSDAAATSATLTFTLTDSGIDSGETMIVESSVNGGAWANITTYDGAGTPAAWSGVLQTIPVALSGSGTVAVRFRVGGNDYDNNEQVYVDDVDIAFNSPANASGTQIRRTANLTGAASATLSFSYTGANLQAGDTVVVEASADGTSFTVLETLDGLNGSGTKSYNLKSPTDYTSLNTTIRLRVTSGINATNETFSVDDVDITYQRTPTAVQRTANVAGALAPSLSFSYASANLVAGDTLVVEASSSAGGPFTTLATFNGGTPSVAPPYDLTAYLSATTTVRFRITGGFAAVNKTFSLDNVDITYSAVSTFASGSPPDFLSSATACRIRAGGTPVTLTFDATVDNPLASGITSITNTASTTSATIPLQVSASVTNIVANPSLLSASVAGRVWFDGDGDATQDIGEPGIANVEVTLKDRFGTPVATATTDANGRYLFSGVKAGTGYYVEVTDALPSGLTQTAPGGRTDNRTNAFNLAAGQDYAGADLGYRSAPGFATFGDVVWVDASIDGVRDSGEVGLGGTTVQLYFDSNGNGIIDGPDTLAGTATTAPDGSYLFTGVTADGVRDYIVAVVSPAGYTPTTNTTRAYPDVLSGSVILTADFGFRANAGSLIIRDRVWRDTDGNGVFDAGENGIAGVTVELLNSSLQVIGTTTTTADGAFTFSGVAGGGADYTVRINDTGGVLIDFVGTTSYAIARQRAESNLSASVDRVTTPPPSYGFRPTRAIGDTIFRDVDGDGVQDPGEGGFTGVSVRLYRDLDNDGVIDVGEPLVGTVATDANGQYLFAGLANASYIVSVPTAPAGYAFTGPGGDSDGGTAGIQKTATMSGSNVLDIDFGYQASPARALSGTIWADQNADGVIDVSETRLAGVTVDVYSDLDGDGVIDVGEPLVSTVTTDAAGVHSVAGLASGTYIVRVTDTNGALTGYAPTYEKTEGLLGPFNYQESVNLTAGNAAEVNFGYGRPQLTYAAVADLRAYRSDGSVVVEWRTTFEAGTAGFNLFRLDPATNGWTRLNDRLLPGLVVHPEGGTYRFLDSSAPPGDALVYRLVEKDTRGAERGYGPYSVRVTAEDPSPLADAPRTLGRSGFDRLPAAVSPARRSLARATAAARQAAAHLARATRRSRVLKVTTKEAGLHYLTAAQLASPSGLPPAVVTQLIRKNALRLTNRGWVVPWLPDAGGAGVYFYAQAIDSIYTADNAFRVSFASSRPMRTVASAPARILATSFQETAHVEEDQFPLLTDFHDLKSDFWFWEFLFAGYDGLDAKTLTVRAPGVAGTGEARLVVHLMGGTEAGVPGEHNVTVSLNGNALGGVTWDGITRRDAEFPLAASDVLEGDNAVVVKAVLDAGVPESIVYLDSVDLEYERLYRAENDELAFAAPGFAAVEVAGFSSADVLLLDVTRPAWPALVVGHSVLPAGDGTYTLHFGVGRPEGGRYLAVAPRRAKAPVAVTAWQSAGLLDASNRADYVLVAPEFLADAAQSLADYRTGRGVETKVVPLEAIYDTFNYGFAEPQAIRSFLRYATSRWSGPPRYATLVGRGTWDYRDRGGWGDNLVPPLLVGTPNGLVASDVGLADLAGDDGVPEIAIGRLPVLTPQALLDYAAKVDVHEGAPGGPWQQRVLMVADNPDRAGNFTADSDNVAALVPPGNLVDKVYLTTTPPATARQSILDTLNSGAVVFNYIGHGGVDRLADESILTNPDVPLLVNADRLPVFLAMTCSVGNFAIPGYPSLGELLLLQSGGGAYAVWAPSWLSENDLAVRLDKGFFWSVYVDGETVVGDAVVRGLAALTVPGSRDHRFMYNLLGEPVSRLSLSP